MQIIIFPQDNGGVSVIYPTPEFAEQIEAIAVKDVPEGKPWRILNETDLPSRADRDRWAWTESGPLGLKSAVLPVPRSLSFAQLLIGLVTEGWVTTAEAGAWRDRVSLPAQVQAVIAALPEGQQFAAETRALAPSEVLRNDPLVQALGVAAGKTSEELDNFFRTYSEV